MKRRTGSLPGAARAGAVLVAVVGLSFGLRGDGSEPLLSPDQAATLSSLAAVSSYPLYTMAYAADYTTQLPAGAPSAQLDEPWACSLFAALGGPEPVFGRNFDWENCPALVLFCRPQGGYASVSLVDVAFLFPAGSPAGRRLETLSLEERAPLLYAPAIPFDGMNERGLAVGMAAVPSASPPYDPSKRDIHSLGVIREVLDRAATVDEALAIFAEFNVRMEGGPPIHYLIADRAGRSALVELYGGKLVALASDAPWQAATNFLQGPLPAGPDGRCWRYDRLAARLRLSEGSLTTVAALALLGDVSQPSTQWSAVYRMASQQVCVAVGRAFEEAVSFAITGERVSGPDAAEAATGSP